MEQKVLFLDGSATEALRGRLSVYKHELEATLAAKSRANTLPETKLLEAVKKLDDLHANTQKLLGAYHDLPALVLRLKTLEAVHLSASNAMKQLQRLDDTVTSFDAEVQGNKTTLSTISDGLSQNMEEIRTAMKSVSKSRFCEIHLILPIDFRVTFSLRID
jgi:hypothetical protein